MRGARSRAVRAVAPLALAAVLLLSGCAQPTRHDFIRVPDFELLNPANAVVVEVDAVPGREPSRLALDALEGAIRASGVRSVQLSVSSSLPPSPTPYSREELLELHRRSFDAAPGGHRHANGTAFLHIAFLDQEVAEAPGLLGLTFIGSSFIAIFPDQEPSSTLRAHGLPDAGLRQGLERSVVLHELGHAWGLVDCGLPMKVPRLDPRSPCHSVRQDSVMHWAVHYNSDPAKLLLDDRGEPVWRFDAADWADIRAYQRAEFGWQP